MTRVTGVGTVVDLIGIRALVVQTFSGAIIAATGIATSTGTGSNAGVAVITVISTTIGIGVVAGRHS